MNRGLYTENDVLISEYVKPISKIVNEKVVNRLLNGDTHIQTIGNGHYVVDVEIIVNRTQKKRIDTALAVAEALKVSDGTDYWVGVSPDEEIDWEEIIFDKGFYKATFSLDIQETSEEVVT